MRVLALGGSGGMGRFAVREAIKMESIDRVVVADLNASAAQAFASSLGPKAEGLGLDVMNEGALRKAMQEVDAVINTVGPFFRFGPPVLRMAIECGKHYLDICDDWEPTLDMLAMDEQARAAGIAGVVGLGASPGVSNLLALIAMRELDSVDTVYTGWNLNAAVPEEESSQSDVSAAMEHGILQITGRVRVHLEGRNQMVRPLGKVEVEYPGLGRRTSRIFGHPEAITFPHHYPEIQTSLNLAHGMERDRWLILSLQALLNWKIMPPRTGARILGMMEKLQAPSSVEEIMLADELPVMYGLAMGRKNGEKASAGVSFAEVRDFGMGFATGVPLACGLELLSLGRITERGVFAPESGAIDPHAFFDLLATKESTQGTSDGANLVIERSWEP